VQVLLWLLRSHGINVDSLDTQVVSAVAREGVAQVPRAGLVRGEQGGSPGPEKKLWRQAVERKEASSLTLFFFCFVFFFL